MSWSFHFCLTATLLSKLKLAATQTRPNIIFILADDLGYGDVEPYSVYPNMNSNAKLMTPNLVKMAAEGMLFTDSYCGAPVCAPSRCTLMTGRHSGHCDVRENGQFLSLNTTTVASVLRNNGYDTALFGKWGLGAQNQTDENDPVSKGFDRYIGQINQANCHNYYPFSMWEQQSIFYIAANYNASEELCEEPDYKKCLWSGDLWTQNAIDYLSQTERKQKPFFLFLSYTTPHSGAIGSNKEYDIPIPRVSGGPYWRYNGTWPRVEIDYATAVYHIDTFVGEIMETLEKTKLDKNTVVFFASDNGASNEGGQNYEFFASSGSLSGYKRSLKEGGHRTPLIVRYPAKVPAGSISDYQWTFYDFLETAADLANAEAQTVPINDGISMKATLFGQTQAQKEFVYHEYCAPNEYRQGWGQAVRIDNFTGLCIGNKTKTTAGIPVCDKDETFELYDLSTDLFQTKNVATQNPDVVNTMWNIMIAEHTPGAYCGDAEDEWLWD